MVQEAEKNTKRKGIRPWRDGLLIGICTFIVTVASSTSMYHLIVKSEKQEVQRELLSVARIAANLTDVDLHTTLTARDQKNSEAYLQVQKPYRILLKSYGGLRYVYTVVENEGKAHFIIDTQPEDGQESPLGNQRKSTANVMEEYPEISDTMQQALRERREAVEEEPYTDEWGTFISAYVPLYDSHKKFIGIVGADIDAEDYITRINNVRIPYIIGLVIATVLSVVVALAIGHIRTGHSARSEARRKQIETFQAFQQEWLEMTGGFADISTAIDGIVGQMAQLTGDDVEALRAIAGVVSDISQKVTRMQQNVQRLRQQKNSLNVGLENLIKRL